MANYPNRNRGKTESGDAEPDVRECSRCNGSGEIGVHVSGRGEKPGPVPDDAKGYTSATCPNCRGMGYIEE